MKPAMNAAVSILVILSLKSVARGRWLSELDASANVSSQEYPWAALPNDTENNSFDASFRKYYLTQHTLFVSELNATREAGKDLDLVWYGDSLLQCLRYEADVCAGAIASYQKNILALYTSAVWAIGSDTDESLMWRLLNGERPSGIGAKVAVLQIGVNDISTWNDNVPDNEVQGLADHLLEIAGYLADTDDEIQVLVLGFLPRGPGLTNQFSQPSRFTEPISDINSEIENGIGDLERVHFLDCGSLMLTPEGNIDRILMPDALHPSGKGYDVLLRDCWRPAIDQLAKDTNLTVQTAAQEAAMTLNRTGSTNQHGSRHCNCPSPYELSTGESLNDVAAKCGTTVDDIAAANGVDWSKPVDLGAEILIPGCGGMLQKSGQHSIAG